MHAIIEVLKSIAEKRPGMQSAFGVIEDAFKTLPLANIDIACLVIYFATTEAISEPTVQTLLESCYEKLEDGCIDAITNPLLLNFEDPFDESSIIAIAERTAYFGIKYSKHYNSGLRLFEAEFISLLILAKYIDSGAMTVEQGRSFVHLPFMQYKHQFVEAIISHYRSKESSTFNCIMLDLLSLISPSDSFNFPPNIQANLEKAAELNASEHARKIQSLRKNLK